MAQKLNQVLAVEKQIKNAVNPKIDASYHLGQKGEPFVGFIKQYTPKDETGDRLPSERKVVQAKVTDLLKEIRKDFIELVNHTATKDFANCEAKADVVIDGVTVIPKAPATFLLEAEKRLVDIRAIISKLPTLSTDESWTKDVNLDIWKTDPIETLRSQKVQEPIVVVQPTKEHPAQVAMVNKDVTIGSWQTVKHSGAMPVPEKERLLERIDTALKAVKYAREQANMTEAPPVGAGAALVGWVFAE